MHIVMSIHENLDDHFPDPKWPANGRNKVRVVCTNQLDIWENRSLWFQATSLVFVGGRILTVLWEDDENLEEIYAVFVNCNETSHYNLSFLEPRFHGMALIDMCVYIYLYIQIFVSHCREWPSEVAQSGQAFASDFAAARQRTKRTNRRTQMIHKFAGPKFLATSRFDQISLTQLAYRCVYMPPFMQESPSCWNIWPLWCHSA